MRNFIRALILCASFSVSAFPQCGTSGRVVFDPLSNNGAGGLDCTGNGAASSVPASGVTAGTFGAGDYVFPGNLTIGSTFLTNNVALAPPANPVVTQVGTPGGTTYTYTLQAFNTIGHGLAGTEITTTTGNATLTVTDYNNVTTSCVGFAAGTSIAVFRNWTDGANTIQGRIDDGTLVCGTAFHDIGQTVSTGANAVPPSGNTSQGLYVSTQINATGGITAGNSNFIYDADLQILAVGPVLSGENENTLSNGAVWLSGPIDAGHQDLFVNAWTSADYAYSQVDLQVSKPGVSGSSAFSFGAEATYTGSLITARDFYIYDNFPGNPRYKLFIDPTHVQVASDTALGFAGTNNANSSQDTGFSRLGSASAALGNGTPGDFSGTMKLANLNVTDLKTTGSAASKKVVCVDTSDGKLYASSTGTDCSN